MSTADSLCNQAIFDQEENNYNYQKLLDRPKEHFEATFFYHGDVEPHTYKNIKLTHPFGRRLATKCDDFKVHYIAIDFENSGYIIPKEDTSIKSISIRKYCKDLIVEMWELSPHNVCFATGNNKIDLTLDYKVKNHWTLLNEKTFYKGSLFTNKNNKYTFEIRNLSKLPSDGGDEVTIDIKEDTAFLPIKSAKEICIYNEKENWRLNPIATSILDKHSFSLRYSIIKDKPMENPATLLKSDSIVKVTLVYADHISNYDNIMVILPKSACKGWEYMTLTFKESPLIKDLRSINIETCEGKILNLETKNFYKGTNTLGFNYRILECKNKATTSLDQIKLESVESHINKLKEYKKELALNLIEELKQEINDFNWAKDNSFEYTHGDAYHYLYITVENSHVLFKFFDMLKKLDVVNWFEDITINNISYKLKQNLSYKSSFGIYTDNHEDFIKLLSYIKSKGIKININNHYAKLYQIFDLIKGEN